MESTIYKGGTGLKLTPLVVRHPLGPPGMSGPMLGTYWTHATPNCPNRAYGPPLAAYPPPPLTHDPIHTPLICVTCDSRVVVKIL